MKGLVPQQSWFSFDPPAASEELRLKDHSRPFLFLFWRFLLRELAIDESVRLVTLKTRKDLRNRPGL
jgi:hypothetical protein